MALALASPAASRRPAFARIVPQAVEGGVLPVGEALRHDWALALRQDEHFARPEVQHDFVGGEQRAHGLADILALAQAVIVLLLAMRGDNPPADKIRPVFCRVVIVEIEQGAHARVADKGRPAAFVEVAHLRDILKDANQLHAIARRESNRVFDGLDMAERRQLVKHEADRQRRRVERVGHLIERGGERRGAASD